MREDVNIEFRESDRNTGKLPDSLSKEIVAFANTEGGEEQIQMSFSGSNKPTAFLQAAGMFKQSKSGILSYRPAAALLFRADILYTQENTN